MSPDRRKVLKEDEMQAVLDEIVDVLKTCYDPEIPVNIYDLGLIYEIDIDEEATAHIQMTLTSPACPVAELLPAEVKARVERLEQINQAKVEVVWDPPWSHDLMSEEAKLELGMI